MIAIIVILALAAIVTAFARPVPELAAISERGIVRHEPMGKAVAAVSSCISAVGSIPRPRGSPLAVQYPIQHAAVGCINFALVEVDVDVRDGVSSMSEGGGNGVFRDVE